MNGPVAAVGGAAAVSLVTGAWLVWQLLRQNGRTLLRIEALEERLNQIEFREDDHSSVAVNANELEGRFGNRSLTRSKIKRDGLKAGTPAPEFRLPRLDGGDDLALSDLHGKRVLLVFSSPNCGPCNGLAPELEKFHRACPEIEVVMISRGEPKENRAKAREHGLTFTIVLQQQWEISRRYAMFATPIAYLIDENGVIAEEVAIGVEPIVALMAEIQGTGAHVARANPSAAA